MTGKIYEGRSQMAPRALVTMTTPLPRFTDGFENGNPIDAIGLPLESYVDAELEFAHAHSIPLLDLFRSSGLNHYNQAI